jgi:hypothetical protein
MELVIPYRAHTFQTALSGGEIEAAVRRHTHLGQWDGLLVKSKPYFGELAPGYFCVRETGFQKRYSNKPTLAVRFQPHASGQQVVLKMHPHVAVAGLAVLFVGSCAYFLLLNIVRFFGAWDPAPVVTSLCVLAFMAGCFVLPYHFAAARTMRFWKRELMLRAV